MNTNEEILEGEELQKLREHFWMFLSSLSPLYLVMKFMSLFIEKFWWTWIWLKSVELRLNDIQTLLRWTIGGFDIFLRVSFFKVILVDKIYYANSAWLFNTISIVLFFLTSYTHFSFFFLLDKYKETNV